MLSEEERTLAAALKHVEGAVPEGASSSAVEEVAALLRRLGSQECASGEPPPDEASAPRDDRLQEQRPG
jgi:hypothetical protein